MQSRCPAHAFAALALLLAAVAAGPAASRPAVTTRPAATRPLADGPPQTRALARLLELDDLTPDQRKQLEAIAADVRAKAQSGNREQARAALADARERALAVLTPAQQARLRDEFPRLANRPGAATRRSADDAKPVAGTTHPAIDDTMMNGNAAPAPGKPDASVVPAAATRPTAGNVARVGDRLPTFTLARLDGGRPITSESLVGRPSVIVFGSYSSPAFRDQLPRLADLASRYGSRAAFVFVYTREQFPDVAGQDQPERNTDDKISVKPAAGDADRKAAAKEMLAKLKLRVPLALDSSDDALANAVGGFPNAAIVADAKGVIVARYEWAEPFNLKRQLDAMQQAPH